MTTTGFSCVDKDPMTCCWDSLLHVGGAFKDAKLELLQPLTPTHVS